MLWSSRATTASPSAQPLNFYFSLPTIFGVIICYNARAGTSNISSMPGSCIYIIIINLMLCLQFMSFVCVLFLYVLRARPCWARRAKPQLAIGATEDAGWSRCVSRKDRCISTSIAFWGVVIIWFFPLNFPEKVFIRGFFPWACWPHVLNKFMFLLAHPILLVVCKLTGVMCSYLC